MAVSPARSAAYEILLRVEGMGAYASELLHGANARRLSDRDHRLCTELVMGVLRWRGALDKIIATQTGRELNKFDHEVSTSLRLGLYQLLCLDRVPARAAIYESVEIVKRARKRSAAGMVNAILRNVKNGGAILDHDAGHPHWLIERWRSTYGARLTNEIREYDQRTPPTAIRVGSPDVVRELEREAIELAPGRLLGSAFVVNAGDITRARPFLDHRVTIQDEASQLLALLVGKGKTILDCCAAPGGKTRIMAEQNPQATIFALDLHPRRAALVRRLVALGNVQVIAADARRLPLRGNFERILVDAPCSGTGTLARNPEIKWRLEQSDLQQMQAYQLAIISGAIAHVAPGGRLVYSTCSLEPEENEQVIDKLLAEHSAFHLVSCAQELDDLRSRGELVWPDISSLTSGPYLRTLPGVHPSDGFFAAILERK